MREWPLPVIMLSSHTESGKAIEAIQAGAVDFIVKPTNEFDTIRDEIIIKIKTAALARLARFKQARAQTHRFNSTRKKIVIIATSTGGPQTLEALLTELPKNIPASILIVQHMPPYFTKSLAERLNTICQIEVKEAQEGDELKVGTALIAPGGFHMELKAEFLGAEGKIRLNKEPPELGVRPCANKLFKSVAPIFKENTIAVVLTGMGTDGTEGCVDVKKFNGTVIAEAEKSCIIYGMPKSVIERGLVDEIIDIDTMAVALVQLLDV